MTLESDSYGVSSLCNVTSEFLVRPENITGSVNIDSFTSVATSGIMSLVSVSQMTM